MSLTPEEKSKYDADKARLDAAVKDAYAAVKVAENISKEVGISFSFNLSYGMGGDFEPKPKVFAGMTRDQALAAIREERMFTDGEKDILKAALGDHPEAHDYDWEFSSYYENEGGWVSSSDRC